MINPNPLSGARYVGKRHPLCDPQGNRIAMHVVEVVHDNGPWEAIYCHTEDQARAIPALFERIKYLEASLQNIVGIPLSLVGGDWDEIEQAQEIAAAAIREE